VTLITALCDRGYE